jgi:F0F1-type ATP synthase membrane subunit b/b'
MEDERDEIVRDDFPIARRGYDPHAVRTHLEAIRERTSLAKTAGDRVADIIETAERTAAEIEQTARREAKHAQREAAEIREQASREAQRILNTARSEGKEQAERAVGALTRLVEEADVLRTTLAQIGEDVTTEIQGDTGAETLDMAPEDASPHEVPKSQRSFRFRRPDSRALVPTGEAESEAARAAESDTPGTAKPETAGTAHPEAADDVEPEAAGRQSERPTSADAGGPIGGMGAMGPAAARGWRRRRRPSQGS